MFSCEKVSGTRLAIPLTFRRRRKNIHDLFGSLRAFVVRGSGLGSQLAVPPTVSPSMRKVGWPTPTGTL